MSDNKYLRNEGCPKCGSSDALGVYEKPDGTLFGKCFSAKCGEVISEDELDTPKTLVKKSTSKLWAEDPTEFHDLISRGISKATCKKWGVYSDVDDSGNDITHYYKHNKIGGGIAWAIRDVKTKKFSWHNHSDKLELFGQSLCGHSGKMIIITEGVCDKLAVDEMLAKCDKSYRSVSIINGAGAATKDIKNNYEWLNGFENIFLAFDQDEPGQKAAKEVAKLYPPGKVKNLVFELKDANDMLRAGKHKQFLSAIFEAKEGRPEGIVSVEDLYEEAISPPVAGKSTPWTTLTEATYGYRTGELWGIGAGSGCGKTEFFKEMINNTIYVHNEIAGVIFLEEHSAKTLKVLAGKRMNKRFHIPADKGGNWTISELIDGINDLKGKVFLYNHQGSKDWETIKERIRYMVNVLGIKTIYLDHLTALVAQEDNEYKALNRLMEEMSSLTHELECTIFYISHLRKSGGVPHEEGGRVSADQFKGSGAIVFWSNFLLGLERNQQAETAEERNTTTLRVLKDRNTGLATGVTFKLVYDHDTGRWNEKTGTEDFDDFED